MFIMIPSIAQYLYMLRYYLKSYSQLMSPLKSSKLMWPQLSELKSTSLTRARCPMKAPTSQILRVIPSVQNLDAAFLTTCKTKTNIKIPMKKKTIFYRPFRGAKTRLHILGEKKGMYPRKTRVEFWITEHVVGTLTAAACFHAFFFFKNWKTVLTTRFRLENTGRRRGDNY